MPRLAVARLWHEGNSFSPVPTTLAQFRACEWSTGEAARELYRGTATEIGAALAFAESRPDWEVTFLRCAAAPPGGPILDKDFEVVASEILDGLAAGRWDAVYLSLHGALVTASRPRPELELLQAVRRQIGDVPFGASFDLHANLGPAVLGLLDVAAGYKTYPHVDMAATATRVLELLALRVAGRIRPIGAIAKAGVLLTSFNMRTTDGPMAELRGLASEWEARPGVLDATVFGGFAYGDSPDAGAAAMVFTDGSTSSPSGRHRASPKLSGSAATGSWSSCPGRRKGCAAPSPPPRAWSPWSIPPTIPSPAGSATRQACSLRFSTSGRACPASSRSSGIRRSSPVPTPKDAAPR